MADIEFRQLIELVTADGRWGAQGAQPPDQLLHITLESAARSRESQPFASELAGKTITYEARERTVVLDFDDAGYLSGIEFV